MAFTANAVFQSSNDVRTSGAAVATPALLTRMSTRSTAAAAPTWPGSRSRQDRTHHRRWRSPWHRDRAVPPPLPRSHRGCAPRAPPVRHARQGVARWRRRCRGQRRSRPRAALERTRLTDIRCWSGAHDWPSAVIPVRTSLKFKLSRPRGTSGIGVTAGLSRTAGSEGSRRATLTSSVSRRVWPQRRRRCQAPPSVTRESYAISAAIDPIPLLAGHLPMPLIQRLAVIRERTLPDLGAEAAFDLEEPVGIGQRLTGGADDVCGAFREDALRPARTRECRR